MGHWALDLTGALTGLCGWRDGASGLMSVSGKTSASALSMVSPSTACLAARSARACWDSHSCLQAQLPSLHALKLPCQPDPCSVLCYLRPAEVRGDPAAQRMPLQALPSRFSSTHVQTLVASTCAGPSLQEIARVSLKDKPSFQSSTSRVNQQAWGAQLASDRNRTTASRTRLEPAPFWFARLPSRMLVAGGGHIGCHGCGSSSQGCKRRCMFEHCACCQPGCSLPLAARLAPCWPAMHARPPQTRPTRRCRCACSWDHGPQLQWL